MYFSGNGTNRLIVDAGAVFHGAVVANSYGTNTIELSVVGGEGEFAGMGGAYRGFQYLVVDAGATWTISGAFGDNDTIAGTTSGGTVESGDLADVLSGGVAAAAVVSSGGSVKVLTGGTTSYTHVESSGILLSISGQLSDTMVFAGGMAEEFGGSSNYTTLSGAQFLVFNGAVASRVYVGSGGFALAGEFAGVVGGTIVNAEVSSGGLVAVGNNAVVSGAMIYGGGTLFELAGITSRVELSGSQVVATSLFGPPQLAVASATAIESGGLQTVNADGSTVDATILNGGEVLVSSGGVAEGAAVSSGGILVSVYGDISSTTILGGGVVDQFVGSSENLTVSGGHLLVLNGAVTNAVDVAAGGFALAGTFAGGAIGGTIDDATVSSGGLVVLGTQSNLSGLVLQNGGILFELAGQASDISLAGLEYVGGSLPGVTPPNPPPPAVTTSATVSSGGMQIVNFNGSAVDTNVLSGGEIVFNGGVVSGLSASKGGVIDLSTFSFSSATSLAFVENGQNTGGTLTVSSGIHSLAINLLGQYVAGGFRESQDEGIGTLITYTGSAGSVLGLLATHR